MNGTAMVMELTTFERSKLAEIQRACPNVDVQLVSMADGYVISGYKGETDEALIRVHSDSMAQAERLFTTGYRKLMKAGWFSAGGGAAS